MTGTPAPSAEDLERAATVAFLTGKEGDSPDLLGRAHRAYLDQSDAVGAARCAFWLAFGHIQRGEQSQAGGWIARAHRLLDEGGHDCAEQGYLLIPEGMRQLATGEVGAAKAAFQRAVAIGQRFGDLDLIAMGRHGEGRAEIRLGHIAQGLALLDEVMVAVTGGEISPKVAGGVYCGVLSACRETFDIRRAHEWTSAFSQWCTAQPDLVPFRGYCLIRRAEILQLHGDWDEALDEVRKAAKRMDDPASKAELGAATYQEAEIHRLRGEFREAEERYREANQLGHQPQPGLAQLRLAQGQADTALAAIARALESASARRNRPPLLFPAVEIMLAAEDHSSADRAAEELASIAEELGGPMLRAMSAHATGATQLAGGAAHQALASLRDAGSLWQELRAPYELARVRVLLAIACRELGDTDSAELELDAARQCFGELGAAPELERLERLAGTGQVERGGKLTARELEVLRRLAKGETNRAIAARLAISEKTVARHVSNIFTKLDLSSRAAATAYAFQHNLVGG